MTSSSFQQLPFSATGAVWGATKSTLNWALALFLNDPLKNIAIALLGFAIAISFSNALFWQTGVHPAPMFTLQQQHALSTSGIPLQNASAPHPRQFSASRTQQQSQLAVSPLNQPIPQPVFAPTPVAIDKVTNEILAQAQTVLAGMGMFSGNVDGYYGPLTAEAIRAFERNQGLTVKGAMTPEIIGKIIAFGAGQANGAAQAVPISPAPVSSVPASSTPVSSAPVPVVSQPVAQQVQTPNSQPHIDEGGQAVPDLLRSIASSVNPSLSANTAPVIDAQPTYDAQTDKQLIEKIQRGLSSLGFYYSSIDGVLGESTARAIREFENFKSFEMTGRISPQLLIWLQEAGAIT